MLLSFCLDIIACESYAGVSGKIPQNSAFAVLVDGEKLLTCRFKHSRLLLPLVTIVSVVFNIVTMLSWLGETMKIASSLVQR